MCFGPLFGPICFENDLGTYPFEPAPSRIDRETNRRFLATLRHIKPLQQKSSVVLLQPKVAHYYVTREICVRPARPGRPAVRPSVPSCHAPVTLHWMVNVPSLAGVETCGIDVTRRAESIDGGIISRGRPYILQPETAPCHALSRTCHAPVTPRVPGSNPVRATLAIQPSVA